MSRATPWPFREGSWAWDHFFKELSSFRNKTSIHRHYEDLPYELW